MPPKQQRGGKKSKGKKGKAKAGGEGKGVDATEGGGYDEQGRFQMTGDVMKTFLAMAKGVAEGPPPDIITIEGPRYCHDRSTPSEAEEPSNTRLTAAEIKHLAVCLDNRPAAIQGNLPRSVRWRSRVRITGLGEANADLNGQEGRCGLWDGDDERFTVYLESGRVLSIRPANIINILEPRVVLAGLTGAEAVLNGETGIRIPVSLIETLMLPEMCRTNGECGAEDRDLIEVVLDKNGREVEVRQGNTCTQDALRSSLLQVDPVRMRTGNRVSTYHAISQHVPGSIPLPSIAEMKRAASGSMMNGCIAFRGDVYLRDLSPRDCYQKLSKWAKREGKSKLMWEVMPASTGMADELIKLSMGETRQTKCGKVAGMMGETPMIMWPHSIAATGPSTEAFAEEFFNLVRSAGRLGKRSSTVLKAWLRNPERGNAASSAFGESMAAGSSLNAACFLPSCAMTAQHDETAAPDVPEHGSNCLNERRLLQCSGCHDALYCSPEHQRADWVRHKKECRRAAKSKKMKAGKNKNGAGGGAGGGGAVSALEGKGE